MSYIFLNWKSRLKYAGGAVLLGGLSVVMLLAGVPTLADGVRTAVSAEQVEGVASEVRESCGQGVCNRWAVVAYSVSGDRYEEEMEVDNRVVSGDHIVVVYQPGAPEVAVTSIGRALWIGGASSLLALVFLLIAAGHARRAIWGREF